MYCSRASEKEVIVFYLSRKAVGFILLVIYTFINDLHAQHLGEIACRNGGGLEIINKAALTLVWSHLERKGKHQIKFKWAALMRVMGTHLKTNTPQRIYRTPLIIGKRQILQLSSGKATSRIQYIAQRQEKCMRQQGDFIEIERKRRRETWTMQQNRTANRFFFKLLHRKHVDAGLKLKWCLIATEKPMVSSRVIFYCIYEPHFFIQLPIDGPLGCILASVLFLK